MKFKVGDKVRVIKNLEDTPTERLGVADDMYKYVNKVATIIKVRDYSYSIDLDNGYWCWGDCMLEELVTNDYITTKDFIKEVRKLGYEVDKQDYEIIIKSIEGKQLVVVRLYELMQIDTITYYFGLHGVLFDLVVKYAKTPIEFREEPKKYTLELPNNNLSRRYYAQNKLIKEHYKFTIKSKGNNNTYKADFTQQEIDNLPNQELIKCLIKKEVEND